MDNPSQVPSMFGSRFYYEKLPYTYPFGNTRARDYLEYAPSDLVDPSILVLGCGDIRSCFYTIWKNFDPNFEHRFNKVHFVLNDISAAVLARNVLFLYLCVNLPKTNPSRQKWLLAFWSIWFCHELLPDHESVLQSSLKALLDMSVDDQQWSSPHNLLCISVRFSPNTLKVIRGFWSMWYHKEVNVNSVNSMRVARREKQRNASFDLEIGAFIGRLETSGNLGQNLCGQKRYAAMKEEYRAYLELGSAFGESVLGDTQVVHEKSSVNYTLYARKDGAYTVHYGSSPFRCFQHVYVCSIDEMIAAGMHLTDSTKDCLRIATKEFARLPLLANSFQQFLAWVSSTGNILRAQLCEITFTFNCLDALQFCHFWETERRHHFDLIYASNVIDSVSPPAFVLAATRLLKDSGYFLSATMKARQIASTADGYIEASFGFHPKLLPVICGVRCINHEGKAYSSSISPNHIPVDTPDVSVALRSLSEATLIWERVDMDPLQIDSLESSPEVCQALCNSFQNSCTPLFSSKDGMRNYLCTDTTILLLKAFTARLKSSLSESYQFWEKLCSDLRKSSCLKPFLASIQTQAILNCLHLHVIVDETTCPMCTNSPISSYFRQFCVKVKAALITDFVMVCLQKNQSAEYIDCVVGVPKGPNMEVFFVAPLTFLEGDFRLTLVQYKWCELYGKASIFPSPILSGELRTYLVKSPFFLALPKLESLCEPSPSLGSILKHDGNGDSFESILSFGEDKLPNLLKAHLQVEQVSRTKVKVECLQQSVTIKYPYPVVNVVVQHSKKQKTLTVKARRTPYQYQYKGQLFHVNPEDHLSLPPVVPDSEKLEYPPTWYEHLSPKEKEIFSSDVMALTSPLLKVKRILTFLLTLTDDFFFRFQLPDGRIVGLVKVINRVVDVRRKAPAVDLHYCFLDSLDNSTSTFISEQLALESYNTILAAKNLFLYEEAVSLLKKVFQSFSRYTMPSASEHPLTSVPPLLKKCKIDHFFTRAVVYLLYGDCDVVVDEYSTALSKQTNQESEESKHSLSLAYQTNKEDRKADYQVADADCCSFCHKQASSLKRCSRCHTAPYCGRKCQQAHWKEHKINCSLLVEDLGDGTLTCAYCRQFKPRDLKKCAGCGCVSYCSKQCQHDDWYKHKLHCKKVTGVISLPTSFSDQQETSSSPGALTSKSKRKLQAQTAIKPDEHSEDTVRNDTRCVYCHKLTKFLKLCTRCQKASYCGKECQKKHWKEHKKICKP